MIQISLDKHNFPEVSQEETENLNIPKIIIVIVRDFKPTHKENSRPMWFQSEVLPNI